MNEGFTTFGEITNLDKEKILDKQIFEYIFTIDDIGNREKIIMQLEKRAKELEILPNFKRVFKQYEKTYSKQEKQKNLNEKMTHNEVADELIKNEKIAKYEGDIYIYENGVYKSDDQMLGRKIIKIKEDSTINFRKEVYEYLKILPDVQEVKFDRECGFINFKNGLYNFKKKNFIEHTPDIFLRNQINVKYNPNAEKVQAIDDVLEKLSCGVKERKQTILEMIGYTMTTSVRLQKAFILYGNKARNGKSTLIDIIEHLLGEENVGTTSFKDMNQNKFAGSGIKNKLLNSGSEMTDEYIIDVETFKNFVTGDYMEIEEKFKARQRIRPYSKFIFSANELPKVADKTDGFYRRLQIIPLEYSFTDKDRKVFDFNKLISNEALEYLAKISLDAFLNMGDNFANYKENQEEIEKYKTENNNILSFVNDRDYLCQIIEQNSVRKASEVYVLYKQYCTENQYKPIGMQRFYKEIEKSQLISYIGHYNHQKTYTLNKEYYSTP